MRNDRRQIDDPGALTNRLDPIKALKGFALRFLSTEKRFDYIDSANRWRSNESRSGTGSGLTATNALRSKLPQLIRDLGVEQLLDAPCGDFNWMQHVIGQLPVHYIGMDIVRKLIDLNNETYASDRIEFRHGNIITGPVPQVDLILCRDCFIHFSFRDTARAIATFQASGSKYLLTNNYPGIERNHDIVTGQWRSMNLSLPPYNLPNPLLKIQEDRPWKQMWLWELRQL